MLQASLDDDRNEEAMTTPKNRMSYTDVLEVFQKALDDERGIRVPFKSYSEARKYQTRLHSARAVDRLENKRTYPEPDHPLHGQSAYDILQVAIRMGEDGTHFVYIEKKSSLIGEIESLSELEAEESADDQTIA